MQTLKTAIVVVLLLTVTYSAYVALTAPTPEMPPEMAALVESERFDLGELGMGEIDPGISDDFVSDPSGHASVDPGYPDPATGPSGVGSPLEAIGSASAHLTDQTPRSPAPLTADGPTGESSSGPKQSGFATPGAPQSLPKPDPSAGSVSADPKQNYPATPWEKFDLLAGEISAENSAAAAAPSLVASGSSTSDGVNTPADTGSPTDTTSSDDTISPTDTVSSDGVGSSDGAGAPDGIAASKSSHPGLVNAIATADRQWENQQLREALTTLSLFYNDPELQPADREPLQARLDMLAGEVIYSSRHLLEQPYRVREGDTLQTISETYQVPWQLLANINQVQDPAAIVPGQDLKIMRGPFRAEINLKRSELTLFLGELYAGRFPVTVGRDPAPAPGTYAVEDKQTARTYYSLTGGNIPAGDPRNPYGDVWMDLGGQICIHGSPQSPSGEVSGCIQLQTADAGDVYGILSKGSAVSIMR